MSKTETSGILNQISKKWNRDLPKIKNIKVHYVDDNAQILVGANFKILRLEDEFIPFLSESELLESFPNVTVDMGAVKFMCNGANVMRPGIKNHTEFSKDEIDPSPTRKEFSESISPPWSTRFPRTSCLRNRLSAHE